MLQTGGILQIQVTNHVSSEFIVGELLMSADYQYVFMCSLYQVKLGCQLIIMCVCESGHE